MPAAAADCLVAVSDLKRRLESCCRQSQNQNSAIGHTELLETLEDRSAGTTKKMVKMEVCSKDDYQGPPRAQSRMGAVLSLTLVLSKCTSGGPQLSYATKSHVGSRLNTISEVGGCPNLQHASDESHRRYCDRKDQPQTLEYLFSLLVIKLNRVLFVTLDKGGRNAENNGGQTLVSTRSRPRLSKRVRQASSTKSCKAAAPAHCPPEDIRIIHDADEGASKKPQWVTRHHKLGEMGALGRERAMNRGHYATVWRGYDKESGRKVAIKKIKKCLTDERRLHSEIAVLRKVGRHANIVELIDVFETTKELQLVMELCTGGELFERLASKGPYSEADCIKHITDMAHAVLYLHKRGIVHRDLKPENILLSTSDEEKAIVKVADFGLAKVVTGNNLKTKCGTWGYSAPEMVSGSGYAFGYTSKVDSWSLGTILYILLCGYHPFDPHGVSTDNQMMQAIKTCTYDFDDEAWLGISEEGKDLISHLLVLDSETRYSMEELLQHPWMKGGSSAPVVPVSPTIHKDLGRFREQSKAKKAFESWSDEEECASVEVTR